MKALRLVFGAKKATKSKFADFIRNAKSDEKKRIYSAVLLDATRQQNEVMSLARTQQN